MNNRLKFRVWHKHDKEFKPLVALNFANKMVDYHNRAGFVEDGDFEDFEIQRWTGLTDKDGKEIYEGDIVCAESSDNKYLSIVTWCDFDARWGFQSIGCGNTQYLMNLTAGCSIWSVRGNIFENPELLK